MTNRIMLRARAHENTISIQTYTPRMKSPQRFYITYSELDRLQRDGRIIANDIHSFAVLRLDERHDRITFDFTWLTGRSFGRVEGEEQTVNLRWSQLQAFLKTAACRMVQQNSRPSRWMCAKAAPGSCSPATGPT